jgi:endonuclease-3
MHPFTPQEVDLFFDRLAAERPNPKTELNYTNPYTLLVAVVLSAQATDKGVNKVTRALFAQIQSPEQMLALGEGGLKECIKSIGLFNTKAKNLIQLSQVLVRNFAGQVPSTREDLEQLPGVGRKTANVILNVAFGQPTIAVDTHIFRVANRTGLAVGKTPLEVEQQLDTIIPLNRLHDAHHWLVLHGRYTCTAKQPKCRICVVQDLCQYPHKNL